MRVYIKSLLLVSAILNTGCMQKGSNAADPYEPINRNIHKFNMAFDATVLQPPAKAYKAVIPAPVRVGINNAYNNVNMLPTIANDLLQAKWGYAIKDTWRFIANTTFGVAGTIDVASRFGLPYRSNDLGITFAKWGNTNSPYIVIPFLGPSTIRDGFGMMFDYALFTPYPYIESDALLYSLLGLRYVDLRAQMLETDRLIGESLDKYAFIRDAYLQHRQYLITGEKPEELGSLYVADDSEDALLLEDDTEDNPSAFPLTTS